MITQCPHCKKDLNLSSEQRQKVEAALAQLRPGTTLKLGCPACREPIQMQADGSLISTGNTAVASSIEPPTHPDISWLASGLYDEKKTIEDVPKVLVLLPDGEGRTKVVETFEGIGYQVDIAESSQDALVKMRFVNFATVVLHSSIDRSLQLSPFHAHMRALPMEKRRSIYYILVGPEFHTLYDLEALSLSANIVINDNEISHFDIILRKGLRQYDDLFGPYIKAQNDHGAKG